MTWTTALRCPESLPNPTVASAKGSAGRLSGRDPRVLGFDGTLFMYVWVCKSGRIAHISAMKTTIDISDSILAEAKRLAREQNVTLRSLVEEGLRKVIEERSARGPCRVSPVTFGGKGLSPEFQGATWERIRDTDYEES